MKSFPKILIIFFLAIFIIQLLALLFLALAPNSSQAADAIQFKPQVIQDLGYNFDSNDKTTGNIANLVRAIYKYAIGIVGILAAVVLMIGGVLWIVAGGNATAIGEAKAWIGAALTGLVLALLSYTILATINPALVNLKTTGIAQVQAPPQKNTENVIISDPRSYTYDATKECDDKGGKCNSFCDKDTENNIGECSNPGGLNPRQCCKPKPDIKTCNQLGDGYACQEKFYCIPEDRIQANVSCPNTPAGRAQVCCNISNFQQPTTETTQKENTPTNDCTIKGTDCKTSGGQSGYCDGAGNCLITDAGDGDWCGKKDNFGSCITPSWAMCPSGKSRVWTGRSCVSPYYCCK
ncbi:MAG: pilin [bacterium]|nr:pilin [bacterium]